MLVLGALGLLNKRVRGIIATDTTFAINKACNKMLTSV